MTIDCSRRLTAQHCLKGHPHQINDKKNGKRMSSLIIQLLFHLFSRSNILLPFHLQTKYFLQQCNQLDQLGSIKGRKPTIFLLVTLARCSTVYLFCSNRHPITGFIRGILRGVRYAKSLRVLFLHRRSPSWTTLVLYSSVVFIFNEPTKCSMYK